MAEQKYKRLTRERGQAQFSIITMTRSSLWLGDDHLLLVETTGYSETYKRFFFRDVQAFTVYKTKTRVVWNWIWAIILTLSLLIIWASTYDNLEAPGALIAASIVLVVFGMPLLLNNLFGPTCSCQIRTAVQTEALPSLCRVRKTQKVMNRIRPLIIAAQGQLTGEEVSARLRETVLSPPAETAWSGDIPPLMS
jgi:hypothetical protein